MTDYQNNISSLALIFLNIFSKCQVLGSIISADFKKITNKIAICWEEEKVIYNQKKRSEVWIFKAR